MEGNIVPRGTSCGSLGFPLANVRPRGGGVHYSAFERFQGAYISNYIRDTSRSRPLFWYETDSLMYNGSSGCPSFLINGNVIGMQSNTLTERSQQRRGESSRIAISRWVPSTDIIDFAKKNGIIK